MCEIRKYHTHMTKQETDTLQKIIKSIGIPSLNRHTFSRLITKGISIDYLMETMRNNNIIEYHRKGNSNRVLVRSNKNFGGYNICVVFDIDTKQFITAYKNKDKDNHATLNPKNYNKNVQILNYIN